MRNNISPRIGKNDSILILRTILIPLNRSLFPSRGIIVLNGPWNFASTTANFWQVVQLLLSRESRINTILRGNNLKIKICLFLFPKIKLITISLMFL